MLSRYGYNFLNAFWYSFFFIVYFILFKKKQCFVWHNNICVELGFVEFASYLKLSTLKNNAHYAHTFPVNLDDGFFVGPLPGASKFSFYYARMLSYIKCFKEICFEILLMSFACKHQN